MISHQGCNPNPQKSVIIAAACQVISLQCSAMIILLFLCLLPSRKYITDSPQRNDFRAGFHDHLYFTSPACIMMYKTSQGKAIITVCLLFYCSVNDLDDDSGHTQCILDSGNGWLWISMAVFNVLQHRHISGAMYSNANTIGIGSGLIIIMNI